MYLILILFSFILSNDSNCSVENSNANSRSIYDLGQTLSDEDQNIPFPVCNGSGEYQIDDNFSFSDLNGDINGGDYKISIISMNATW
ncbi:hypothetical protein N9597_00735 [Candidatus Marinimicrobia bacterium]|nr:hypothetical protein [Candidatus Neomarinimicrobiota bacterium]